MALIPEVLGAVVETAFIIAKNDYLAPMSGVLTTAVAEYLFQRHESARMILLSQLEKLGSCPRDRKTVDQFAASAVRYFRAARDQAADENLRLLAQAMVKLPHRQTLWASKFLKFADILASLSHDEIILIGIIMKMDKSEDQTEWHSFEYSASLQGSIDRELVKVFGDYQCSESVALRATRSGLLFPFTPTAAGWSRTHYILSPLGREVRDVVDIDAALRPA